MSIDIIFLMSLVVVAATLLTLCRVIGIRRVLRHATVIDVIFTVVACIMLAGTLTGLLIGILAGLVMAGTLTVLGWFQRRSDDLRARYAREVHDKPIEDWCPGGAPDRL
jgi:uncharacterized oligopeptide transporter (OPT) family protein